MAAANPPKLIAVGGVCATGIFRVATVPALPAKVLANRMCRIADGMAVSAACAFARLGGNAAVWARTGDDADGTFIRESLAAEGLDVSGLRMAAAHAGRHLPQMILGAGG